MKTCQLKIIKREITVTQTKEQRSKTNRSVTHSNNTYDATVLKKRKELTFPLATSITIENKL